MKQTAIFQAAEGVHRTLSYLTPMNEGHIHNKNELFFLVDGVMTARCNNQTVEVQGPAVLIFGCYSIHSGASLDDKLYDRYKLYFDDFEEDSPLEQAASFYKRDHLTVIPLNTAQKSLLLGYFERLHHHNEPSAWGHLIRWILYELSCWYQQPRRSVLSSNGYIYKVMQQLARRFDRHITLEELAEQYFISRAKLVADFKRYTGMTVGEYLALIRLHNAKAMLEQGGSVGTVAHACGYGDQSYFIKKFTRMFGLTPKEWKKLSVKG